MICTKCQQILNSLNLSKFTLTLLLQHTLLCQIPCNDKFKICVMKGTNISDITFNGTLSSSLKEQNKEEKALSESGYSNNFSSCDEKEPFYL